MEYKGYTITAEVETYETWSLDENGQAVDCIDTGEFFEITGYHFDNSETGDEFFEAMSATNVEMLHDMVDDRIKELSKEK